MKKTFTALMIILCAAAAFLAGCTKTAAPEPHIPAATAQYTATATETGTAMPSGTQTLTPSSTSSNTASATCSDTATDTTTQTVTATTTDTTTRTATATSTVTATSTLPYTLLDDFEDNDDYPAYAAASRWTYEGGFASISPGDAATGGGNYAFSITGTAGALYYESYFSLYCAMSCFTTSFDAPNYQNGLDLGSYSGVSFTAKYTGVDWPASGNVYGVVRAQNPAMVHIIAEFPLNPSWQQYYLELADFYPTDGTTAAAVLSNIIYIQFGVQVRSTVNNDTQFGEFQIDNIRFVK